MIFIIKNYNFSTYNVLIFIFSKFLNNYNLTLNINYYLFAFFFIIV